MAQHLSLGKRQNDVGLTNTLDGTIYSIQLSIGVPGQPAVVQLDTGSPDLWVNPNCANIGSRRSQALCQKQPRYDYTASSTFQDLGQSTTLAYGKGNATVEWARETVSAGSATVKGQILGVATNSYSQALGILGISPPLVSSDTSPRFIDSLKSQGITKSRAFSLDLRSIDSPDGSIIFGGIDTGKYTGTLEKLPIVPASQSPDGYLRYNVNLNGIKVTGSDGTSTMVANAKQVVLLDSGSTLMYLPQDIFTALGSAFPTARLDTGGSGYYIVDCAVAQQAGTVDFTFGGKTINVLYKDVIWEIDPSTNTCVLGAQADAPSSVILGDSFLRAAYAVFDQDNSNIHLAQAANCGSHLVAIGSGPNAVPSLTGDCGSSSSTSSALPTSTATSASSPSPSRPGSATTYPVSSIPSSKPYSNSTASSYPTYTSTVLHTTTYTITSCAETVTNCPVGSITTETLTSYTTWCPGNATPSPAPPASETTTPWATATKSAKPCHTCGGGGNGSSSETVSLYPKPVTSTTKPTESAGSGGYPATTSSAQAVVTAGVERLVGHVWTGLAVAAAAILLV